VQKGYVGLTKQENLYEISANRQNYVPNRLALQKKLASLNLTYSSNESFLLTQKNKGLDVKTKVVSLSPMQEKLQKAQVELTKNNFPLAEILLLSAEFIGKEIK